MAFQQPQRQQLHRLPSAIAPRHDEPSLLLPAHSAVIDESQEWILFAPDERSSTHKTTSTSRTPRTAGRSRLSDFGSLDTVARSGNAYLSERGSPHEENEDLDSLDDGLHAFHEPIRSETVQKPVEQSADTVLPSHDGLGTFPADQQGTPGHYLPPRRPQSFRRSSFQRQVEALEEEPSDALNERIQRIERWRIDQSRAILDEVEKETKRRRRQSRSRQHRTSDSQNTVEFGRATDLSTNPETAALTPEPDSFWTRFTRRVIRDLMGMDEATLSYIFGEDIPPEGQSDSPLRSAASDLVSHAERTMQDNGNLTRMMASWEDRLLVRVAKELGSFISQLTEHPGAFSAYLRTQETPSYAGMPYAGIPAPMSLTSDVSRQRPVGAGPLSSSNPQFTPTLAHRRFSSTTDPSLWGIEEEDESPACLHTTSSSQESAARQAPIQSEREYWEKDLDVKMVFGFLRDRLSYPPEASRAAVSTPTNKSAQQHPPSSLRRAALIRHHHPLISRSHQKHIAATTSSLASSAAPVPAVAQFPHTRLVASPVLGRRPTSLLLYEEDDHASQSTKKSKTSHTVSAGSSRNYWDFGGGVGGSAVSVVSVGSGGGWLD